MTLGYTRRHSRAFAALICSATIGWTGACTQVPSVDSTTPPVDEGAPASTEVTASHLAAVDALLKSVPMLITAATAVRPVTRLSGYIDGTLRLPACPTPSIDLPGGSRATLALDYGAGCAPAEYSGVNIAGRISGEVMAGVKAYDMVATDLVLAGGRAGGTIRGGYSTNDAVTMLAANVRLTGDGDRTATGVLTLEFAGESAAPRVRSANGSFTDNQRATWSFTANDLTLVAANGQFMPAGGTATLMRGGVEGSTLRVEFGAQTPTAREVRIAIGSGEAKEYTIAGK